MTAMVNAGTSHTSGWIMIRNKQVTIMQDDKMIKNNLVLAKTGLVVFFISALLCLQTI